MTDIPVLTSCKSLKPEFEKLSEIKLTSSDFTIGRGLKNSVVIPYLSISRNHCSIKNNEDNNWVIEDFSTFGISVNGEKLGKGNSRTLSNKDIITLDPSEEFVYNFVLQPDDEIPRKRIKLECTEQNNFLDNVKTKFEESQSYEIKHIEEKIQNAKQMQTTSMILKQQLQLDMNRKIQQLECKYAAQIENLKGEKNEVEKQKALHLAERDTQLAAIKQEMEGKIAELMEQIEKHNEAESELMKENNLLKEKLLKEREEFLSELNRKNSSKEEMLEKLEAKIKEQEEIRKQEKIELEEMLRKETEQLRLAKEQELKELEEQKRLRETELEQELDKIRKALEEKVQQTEQEKVKAQQQLNEQMEQMKKLNDEEKAKMEQLVSERAAIAKQLAESQAQSEKSLEELKARVSERETELAALASERIEKQVEQSSGVINSLQEQLEKVKKQLESVESEKNSLLESMSLPEVVVAGAGPSKQSTLAEVGEVLESELQCSICAELFITATTLNCSHTFCKYCITMWKKKKKDCPICRSPIQSECKSIVIDSFIEKMVQNLTEEMKKKRQELLKNREEQETELWRQPSASTSRGDHSYGDTSYENSDSDLEFLEEEEEEEYDNYDRDEYEDFYSYGQRRRYRLDSDTRDEYEDLYSYGQRRRYHLDSDTSSGSDDDADDAAGAATGDHAAAGRAALAAPADASAPASTTNPGNNRRRQNIPGVPGSYYGGYGRCYSCGARGHWAPGCPFR